MERLLALLPFRSQHPILRYGTATILAAVSLGFVIGLRQVGGRYGLFILYPSIFACSIAFDRDTGLYTTAFEAIGLYALLRAPGTFFVSQRYVLDLSLFVIMGVCLAFVSEGLRRAWERAVEAERAKDLLFRELAHRTKNNLAMVVSVLSFQARGSRNEDVQVALQNALSRIRAISSAHDHMQANPAAEATDMRDYLEELCRKLGETFSGLRPIAIIADVEEIALPTRHAVPLGLVVNELVTNALKYAFPDDREGIVRVMLQRKGALMLVVEDDGVGCGDKSVEGFGSRLVRLLVKQLNGTISWRPQEHGCCATVEFSGL